jgi:hypothetical protein
MQEVLNVEFLQLSQLECLPVMLPHISLRPVKYLKILSQMEKLLVRFVIVKGNNWNAILKLVAE